MENTLEATSTELVSLDNQSETALAPVQSMEEVFAQYAGQGNENVKATDKQTAFLQIVQSNSPYVTLGHPKYNDNARPGMIINTVTNKLYPGLIDRMGAGGIFGIPTYFNSEVVEWAPRDSANKGLKGRHKITDQIFVQAKRNDKGVLVAENGNELRETAYHGFLLYEPGSGFMEKTLIPFASTEMKKSKNWNTQIDSKPVPGKANLPMPRFGQIYKLSVVPEGNAKGNWLGWHIEFVSYVEDITLFGVALAYHKELTASGLKDIKPVDQGDDAGHTSGPASGAASPAPAPSAAQDDVPF